MWLIYTKYVLIIIIKYVNQKWFQQNSEATTFKKLSWYLLNFIYKIIEQVKKCNLLVYIIYIV